MNVKKLLVCISLFIAGSNLCLAQQRAIERIHISTDRTFYVAGESIWLSLYCFDISGREPHFSILSSVAYLELRHEATLLASAKLRIHSGRGSGRLQIPPTLPTGNYRLIAYTKQMLNEDTLRYFDKVVPIYNTLTTERATQNFLIVDEQMVDEWNDSLTNDSKFVDVQLGVDENSVPKSFVLPVSIKNMSTQAITINVSVTGSQFPTRYYQALEDIFAYSSDKITFNERYIPEYEGEIICGVVKNIKAIQPKTGDLFLSAVGTGVEVYATSIDTLTGFFSFFTHSLYGNREIALEYPAALEASFELIDPFVKPPVKPAPPFYMDKKMETTLEQRSMEMQVSYRFGIDTLNERIATPIDPFLYSNKPVVYVLDHYTRLPTMQDIMTEFISQMRFRQNNLEIAFLDAASRWVFLDNPLIVIDGITVFNHERLLRYDPLKVKTVSVYQNNYLIGNKIFNGIAQFNTYSGSFSGLTLGKNALILDFQGVQYPCRFTGITSVLSENLPDVRTLLYWDPQVDIQSGENHEMILRTSLVEGRYAIILEGVTADGQSIFYRKEFTVQ